MLNIYLGNYHPDLEESLFHHISEIKKADIYSQIAVVTPSEHIRKRIKTLLAAERGMSLIGVHFHTFHALSLKLYEEKYGLTSHTICDDFFFAEMIRKILFMGNEGTRLFSHFTQTPEGCMAIRRTIRELREARVEPENIMDGISEGLFCQDDSEKLAALLTVYREFLRIKSGKGIIDYSDLPDLSAGVVPVSAYLKRFSGIIYYGFYDLTQVQFDLLQAIARDYPVTMFFPYAEGIPAASFTGIFYDAFIRGLMTKYSKVVRLSRSKADNDSKSLFPVNCPTAVISASGTDDEVSAVAKTILKLVEADGYPFSGIGVVARDINEYIHAIERIFSAHNIPFVSSGSEAVDRYPVIKAVLILMSIHENGYRRSDIIDLLSSHCCRKKAEAFFPEGTELRPDRLDLFTRLTGITKGLREWERLDKHIREGFVKRGSGDDDGGGEDIVSREEVAGLRSLIYALNNDFTSLPPVSSWSDYAVRFASLFRKYIEIDEFPDEHPAGSVIESLESITKLGIIYPEVSAAEFIETFKRCLKGSENKVCSKDISAVQVLDAMSARAIPFRALFVIGMNEKVFPRNIREDPLLRDSVRHVMVRTLGYKIEEKMNGFEEEKLLFYLLANSARERLYITFQRTDDSGDLRIPSWYISEVSPPEPVKEWKIPRRLGDKYAAGQFYDYYLLTPHELSTRAILEGIDASPVMKGFCFDPALYKYGRESIMHHEKMSARLTGFDGLTGQIEEYWEKIVMSGISPTSMERFALCPFSYFAGHVLRLKRRRRDEPVMGIEPADAGNICHMVLNRFYSGYSMAKARDFNSFLNETARSVFAEFEQNNPVGYPVIWEIERERLLTLLTDFVTYDLHEMSLSGYSPYIYEAPVRGKLAALRLSDYTYDIPVYGIIDRVDRHKDHDRFRIIDYKFKAGSALPAGEGDLILAALRGQRLQPPLYVLMTKAYLHDKAGVENPVCDDVRFNYLAPNWTGVAMEERFSSFPGDCWESEIGEKILTTIKLLLEGIRKGLFFIMPGNYCKTCDYSDLCRKNHFPSRSRARKDERIVRVYMDMRNRKMD